MNKEDLIDQAYNLIATIKPIVQHSVTEFLLKGVIALNPSKDRQLSQTLHMMAALYHQTPGKAWFPPGKEALGKFEEEFKLWGNKT